jgi:hypothetical protein
MTRAFRRPDHAPIGKERLKFLETQAREYAAHLAAHKRTDPKRYAMMERRRLARDAGLRDLFADGYIQAESDLADEERVREP